MTDTCSNVGCTNAATKACSRCKSARYCSRDCQCIHWKVGHKKACNQALHELIAAGNWTEVLVRIETHPTEVNYTSSAGRTVLHLACSADESSPPPSDVIRALAVARPEATEMETRKERWTPLTIACIQGTANTVKTLLELDAGVASKKDGTGDGGATPLRRYVSHLQYSCAPLDFKQIIAKYPGAMEKISLLVKAMFHGTIQDPLPQEKKFRFLHALSGIDACNYMPEFFSFVMDEYKYRKDLAVPDEDGNFPLHLAARMKHEDFFHPFHSGRIDVLLKFSPGAAAHKNHAGQLPLNLASRSGTNWNDGLGAIYRAFPDAINERDGVTGLLPTEENAKLAKRQRDGKLNVRPKKKEPAGIGGYICHVGGHKAGHKWQGF